MAKIFELKHEEIHIAKPEVKKILTQTFEVPRLSVDIINNRWRAYQKTEELHGLDPEIAKFVRAALEHIVLSDIILDQRDVYYGIRGKHPDWKLCGHDLKEEEAYDSFVGKILETLQLVTGYTMQSLGVRAGPRGYVTGDDGYFILPNGNQIPVVANPVIQFNLVDHGVKFVTQTRKLIHYEKAAGMNSLLIANIPTMIEATFMTSQGYSVEAATKMHRDMEKRGLKLYILGDADPHGMNMQLMYGRGSKANAYMPDDFFPISATLLGLFPTIAEELNLPAEYVTDVHMRIVPNIRKLAEETRPDMVADVEVFEKKRKQWEWQALNGIGDVAPAIYLIESLYARNNEIKYVPDSEEVKGVIIGQIKQSLDEYVEKQIDTFAKNWLNENLRPKLVEQLKRDLVGDIESFNTQADEELEKLRNMNAEDLREAIKLKLVSNPKQYWTTAIWKVIGDILSKEFTVNAEVQGDVNTQGSGSANANVTISDPEIPEQPLRKIDIITAIEKRVTGKNMLIQKLRDAIQKILGKPSETW